MCTKLNWRVHFSTKEYGKFNRVPIKECDSHVTKFFSPKFWSKLLIIINFGPFARLSGWRTEILFSNARSFWSKFRAKEFRYVWTLLYNEFNYAKMSQAISLWLNCLASRSKNG